MYHLQTKSYVKCPKDMTRHTAKFVSATKNTKEPYLPVTALNDGGQKTSDRYYGTVAAAYTRQAVRI